MRTQHAGGIGLTLLLALAPGCEPPRPEARFAGQLVLGIDRQPSETALRSDAAGGDWRFEELLDGRTPRDAAAPLADAAGEPSFYWLRPQLARAADAAPVRLGAGEAWDLAHAVVDRTAPGAYADLVGELEARAPGARLGMVEPELDFTDPRMAEAQADSAQAPGCHTTCQNNAGDDLHVCGGQNPHWTTGTFGWQLVKSRLSEARALVPSLPGDDPKRVRVAHLDTGYAPNDALKPARLTSQDQWDFVDHDADSSDPCIHGSFNHPGHGTATLSVLAGNHARLIENGMSFDAPLGGAPDVRVVELRIGNSVIHLDPIRMADAIDWAWQRKIDVISLSMGGFPSWTLRDAVNAAYLSGTAIVAAAGNHYATPTWRGIAVTPSTLVYPARFSRVVAVTGIAYDGRPYGMGPTWWSLVTNGDLDAWSMRGNYGPSWRMDEALAGFTPNVSWSRKSEQQPTSRIADVNGGGTSAATPQVAAAAALWLQQHRAELEQDWNRWQKAEAVYRALLLSAQPNGHDAATVKKYLGKGALDAMRVLEKSTADLGPLTPRPEAEIGLDWVFAGIGPLADAADPEAARRAEIHDRMLRVELAQLVYGSEQLDALLGDAPADAPRSPAQREAFLRAARDDPHASRYLRQAIDAALR